jgi:hypothetical protein
VKYVDDSELIAHEPSDVVTSEYHNEGEGSKVEDEEGVLKMFELQVQRYFETRDSALTMSIPSRLGIVLKIQDMM